MKPRPRRPGSRPKNLLREALRYLSRSLTFAAMKGLALVCRSLSWQAAARWGERIGAFCFLLPSTARQRALAHLRIAYRGEKSDAELETIARGNFAHFGRSLVELLKFADAPDDAPAIEWEGEKWLQEALRAGSGVVLVTGHIGNWELMGAALAQRGYPMHVLATPLRDSRMDDWLLAVRARFGTQTIQRGEAGAAVKIRNALRSNGILACLIDQDTKVEGVFVDFFGEKAYTPTGAVRLARRFHAAVIAIFITRLPDGRHRITIDRPLPLSRTDDRMSDMLHDTARLTARIEQQIRQHPDQWVWMHRRWKSRPNKTKSSNATRATD